MDDAERDFWQRLEYRICQEFEGFEDRRLRFLGCDGLLPQEYDLQSDKSCIRGDAYCGQNGQEKWQFTLLIGTSVQYPEQIDWSALLPPDDVTGWMSPDPDERALIVDPLSAYPDDT